MHPRCFFRRIIPDMPNNPETPVIATRRLRKVFDEKVAVDDLSLTVERGEVFGFLGPNGAGKTTSVKMLLNLITPTSGEGRLFGQPLQDPQVRARVGFLPEHFRFHEWLTASEFLQLHANLYQMEPNAARRRIEELLELVSLTPHANKKLKQFSKGMLQRIGLAQALLNHPDLVILDEPTSGLDPVGRLLVRDIIRELRAAGVTVFLNSHLLSEVEITCDRVAFIKHGQVVNISLLNTLVSGQVSLEIRARSLPSEIRTNLRQWSDNLQHEVLSAGERATLTLPSQESIPEINRYLVQNGIEVFSLTPKQISLDELFLQIIGTDGGL